MKKITPPQTLGHYNLKKKVLKLSLKEVILSMSLSAPAPPPPPAGMIGFLKQAGQIRIKYIINIIKINKFKYRYFIYILFICSRGIHQIPRLGIHNLERVIFHRQGSPAPCACAQHLAARIQHIGIAKFNFADRKRFLIVPGTIHYFIVYHFC